MTSEPWDRDRLQPILRRWDERMRAETSRFRPLVPEADGSVLRSPASGVEIEAAEARLGVFLPPSYRAFLRLSNGAFAGSLGAEVRDRDGHEFRCGFWPAARIAPLAEVDPVRLEAWTDPDLWDFLDDDRERSYANPGRPIEVMDWDELSAAFVIAEPWDACVDLLVPRGDEEWEFWSCFKEGGTAYHSFGDFLACEVERPTRAPDPQLADVYAAETQARNANYLGHLAELGDPRAAELALEMLKDPRDGYARGAIVTLRDLAEPRFLPDLRQRYDQATEPGLRIGLLAALDSCGAPEIKELLSDAANSPDEQLRQWAGRRVDAGAEGDAES